MLAKLIYALQIKLKKIEEIQKKLFYKKEVYGDARGIVPYWVKEYNDRTALNLPDTSTITLNFQKINQNIKLK